MARDFESFSKALEITIENSVGDVVLLTAARTKIAPLVTGMIKAHALAGRFLGGGSQEPNTGYSKNTLPAYYLGKLQKNGSGRWQLQSDKFNKTVTPRVGDLEWRTVRGKKVAYMIGGYRRFKQLAGRDVSSVNLTFTGRMLGSVESQAAANTDGVRITTGATGGEQSKAAYTNAMYEWLGLHDDERAGVRRVLVKFIEDQIGDQPDIRIT